jgi:hypothetical protein
MHKARQIKEFDKLSNDQFSKLVSKLPELRKEGLSLNQAVRDIPKERFAQIFSKDFYWSQIYELTFAEHLAYLLVIMDKVDFIKEAQNSPDPAQYVLDAFDSNELSPDKLNSAYKKQDLIGLAFALQRTILGIMIYHQTIQDMVQDVKNGLDDALFKIIRIDRSAISTPTIAARIARAELQQDKVFFIRLRNALKGPSQKHWESYKDLRYALFILRDLGFNKLTDDQLVNLLVHQLKVYPDRFEAKKNLRKQLNESLKINHLK